MVIMAFYSWMHLGPGVGGWRYLRYKSRSLVSRRYINGCLGYNTGANRNWLEQFDR